MHTSKFSAIVKLEMRDHIRQLFGRFHLFDPLKKELIVSLMSKLKLDGNLGMEMEMLERHTEFCPFSSLSSTFLLQKILIFECTDPLVLMFQSISSYAAEDGTTKY